MNYMEAYKAATGWIERNTIPGQGICVNTDLPLTYPEVTGYYIPSLLC